MEQPTDQGAVISYIINVFNIQLGRDSCAVSTRLPQLCTRPSLLSLTPGNIGTFLVKQQSPLAEEISK